jgi:hypothetical protein
MYEEPDVIVKILSHLKLPTKSPELAPARDPPTAFTRGPPSDTHDLEMTFKQDYLPESCPESFFPESFQNFTLDLD